jgi:hypothetical protein
MFIRCMFMVFVWIGHVGIRCIEVVGYVGGIRRLFAYIPKMYKCVVYGSLKHM